MIKNRSGRVEDGLLLRWRTRVQFRIPPPSTRIRNVFGPFFLPKIPVRSGVSTHGLSNANRPERPQFALFGLFSLFCFRVGEASNGKNQALAPSGSPSPTPAGQASNRATTSRCAAQSTGNGLR